MAVSDQRLGAGPNGGPYWTQSRAKLGLSSGMKADIDLVREIKAGNRAAFSELVTRHQKAIYRLALRFTRDHGTAEDIVQDTFVKAYQKLESFEERSSFKSWLFRIAINTSKNKLRGQ